MIQLFLYVGEQTELLVQVGLGDLHSRIQSQFQRRGLALAANGESHLIMPGSGHGALRAPVVLPQIISGHPMSFLIVQVPDKAVQTGFGLNFFLRFLIVGIERLFRLFHFRA